MNWIKSNPFLAGLLGATAVLVLGAGYLLSNAYTAFTEQSADLDSKKGELAQLLGAAPFPNEANATAAKAELTATQEMVDKLRQKYAPDETHAAKNASDFQHDLESKSAAAGALAKANGVSLPEKDWLMGFKEYQNPRADEDAPALSIQLAAVDRVVTTLLGIKDVRSLNSLVLGSGKESGAPLQEPPGPGPGAPKRPASTPDLALAPFTITFTSTQVAFGKALGKLLESKPPIFIRKVAVANSNPNGPPKNRADEAPAASGTAEAGGAATSTNSSKTPILGYETVKVTLELASITLPPKTEPKQ